MNATTQGFTLIELLIVIAIIGILAVVLLPNILGAQKRAYDTAALSCANALAKAIAIYRVDNPTSSSVPEASTFFNDKAANDSYGAGSKAAPKSGCGIDAITVSGPQAADGVYTWTVQHAQGNNVYTLKQDGITVAKKAAAAANGN